MCRVTFKKTPDFGSVKSIGSIQMGQLYRKSAALSYYRLIWTQIIDI